MPCYDPDAGSAYRAELKKKVNDLTRWLCGLLTQLEDPNATEIKMEEDMAIWWLEHKAWDKARKEAGND